jgi:hypothetical protein
MTRLRRVIRTPVDRQCKVEGTVKTTLKFDFEINHIDTKKKKKKISIIRSYNAELILLYNTLTNKTLIMVTVTFKY